MIEFFGMATFDALIVFAKQPDPLETKTRLSPPLVREDAARLYACFLADTLTSARQVTGVDRVLEFDPPSAEVYFRRLAPDFLLLPQAGRDLGERMQRSFDTLFDRGCRRAVLIGSDLPHLMPQSIEQAFDSLKQGAELVLGPSLDGGYYLVGLTSQQPGLFDLPMSTPDVLRQTLLRAGQLGLKMALLPEEFDVDTPADLERLQSHLKANPEIPALRTRVWLADHPKIEGLGG